MNKWKLAANIQFSSKKLSFEYMIIVINVLPATGYPGYSVWSHLKVIVELHFALDLGLQILPFS